MLKLLTKIIKKYIIQLNCADVDTNMKKGIFNFRDDITVEQYFMLIKSVGFDASMIWWGEQRKDFIATANSHNIEICNAHLPFKDAKLLWVQKNIGDDYTDFMCKELADCANYGVKVAVMHVSRGYDTEPCNRVGLNRIKRLVKTAEENGVLLALENLKVIEYLDYIYDNIESENLKFCLDTGHENYATPQSNVAEKFKHKLVALHLNDNDGTADQHRLPYDGTADWETIAKILAKIKYDGILTLEVNQDRNNIYDNLSPQEYFERAFEMACKFEKELTKISRMFNA